MDVGVVTVGVRQGPAELYWEDRVLYHIKTKRKIATGLSLDEAAELYQGFLITTVLVLKKRV